MTVPDYNAEVDRLRSLGYKLTPVLQHVLENWCHGQSLSAFELNATGSVSADTRQYVEKSKRRIEKELERQRESDPDAGREIL